MPGCLEGCASAPLSQLMTLKVETGKVYLLRFIGSTRYEYCIAGSNCFALLLFMCFSHAHSFSCSLAACFSLAILNIAVGSHNLTMVQIEGTPIEPIDAANFNIGPGQRYAALLNATQPPGSYWLDATSAEHDMPGIIGRAIIQYVDAAEVLPTEEPYHPPWNAGTANPGGGNTIDPESYPEYGGLTAPESEITRYILVTTLVHEMGKDGKQQGLGWGVNNISFSFTTPEPLIGMAIAAAKENGWPTEIPGTIDMPQNPPTAWNYTLPGGSPTVPGPNAGAVGLSVIRANKDQVLEIVFQNANDPMDTHTWHSKSVIVLIVFSLRSNNSQFSFQCMDTRIGS